jgi:hypothetical protein
VSSCPTLYRRTIGIPLGPRAQACPPRLGVGG